MEERMGKYIRDMFDIRRSYTKKPKRSKNKKRRAAKRVS